MQKSQCKMPPEKCGIYRVHRLVCLPDYQGVGIGTTLLSVIASAYRGLGWRVIIVTASPALNAYFKQHTDGWKLKRGGLVVRRRSATMAWRPAIDRVTWSWEYIGPAMDRIQARRLVYG